MNKYSDKKNNSSMNQKPMHISYGFIDKIPSGSSITFKERFSYGNSIKQKSEALFYLEPNKNYKVRYCAKFSSNNIIFAKIISRINGLKNNEEHVKFNSEKSVESLKLISEFFISTDNHGKNLDFLVSSNFFFFNLKILLIIEEI